MINTIYLLVAKKDAKTALNGIQKNVHYASLISLKYWSSTSTKPCFKEKECQGIEPYQFDKSLEIRGVPKIINGEGVCYNCKIKENNYRQVENNFTCGSKAKKHLLII